MDSRTIKEKLISYGADVCGVAGAERFESAPEGFRPTDIYTEAKSVIVFGRQFSASLFHASTNVPYTMVKNASFKMLDQMAVQLSDYMESNGHHAVPIPSEEPYEFWDAEKEHGRAILSLKHAARLAGLGFIGKNTLLINQKYGNRLYLGAVITDAILCEDDIVNDQCPENCDKCIVSCPQNALDTVTVNQKNCRKECTSVTDGGGFVCACVICRKVCPFAEDHA